MTRTYDVYGVGHALVDINTKSPPSSSPPTKSKRGL